MADNENAGSFGVATQFELVETGGVTDKLWTQASPSTQQLIIEAQLEHGLEPEEAFQMGILAEIEAQARVSKGYSRQVPGTFRQITRRFMSGMIAVEGSEIAEPWNRSRVLRHIDNRETDVDNDPEDPVFREDLISNFRKVLSTSLKVLSPKELQVLSVCHGLDGEKGLPITEAAKRLGVSRPTFYKYYDSALAKLAQAISSHPSLDSYVAENNGQEIAAVAELETCEDNNGHIASGRGEELSGLEWQRGALHYREKARAAWRYCEALGSSAPSGSLVREDPELEAAVDEARRTYLYYDSVSRHYYRKALLHYPIVDNN